MFWGEGGWIWLDLVELGWYGLTWFEFDLEHRAPLASFGGFVMLGG